jgi:dCTP deaminase
MIYKNYQNTIQQYIFETIDKIVRFYIHLDEIKEQFYYDEKAKINNKIYFINSYESVLDKFLLLTSMHFAKTGTSELDATQFESAYEFTNKIFNLSNILHENLIHLPRPSEPLELRRFSRVIDKQVYVFKRLENRKGAPHISIYVKEEVVEGVYALDPLSELKDKQVNDLINEFNKTFHSNIPIFNETTDNPLHITIPRIDANNPCHWPTLMHEVAHKLMGDIFPGSTTIEDDFLASLKESQKQDVIKIIGEHHIVLHNWLIECWCDLFAAVSMGHSVLFSQFLFFLNEPDKNTDTGFDFDTRKRKYPPSSFRAILIAQILSHRFSRDLFLAIQREITNFEDLLEMKDKKNKLPFYDNPHLLILFEYFKIYFLEHFFAKKEMHDISNTNNGATLNERFQDIIKFVKELDVHVLNKLNDNLNTGLPIPSKRIENESAISEEPTSVQEILLAGWMHRNTGFKQQVLKIVEAIGGAAELTLESKSELLKSFKRFDQSILSSIQVSEWFDLLKPEDVTFNIKNIHTNSTESSRLLVDYEIGKAICNNKIRVIPVINFNKQLGSTSFDIRLGTSFEIFFQNQHGIIDFTEKAQIDELRKNSRRVNLDFMEPILLSPGQFILGHSMEYIKLDETIAADLEGRSSFARLGIEIHMTAGFVDPGFEGVLTFEIFNTGPNPIKLYPGYRIGQLRFQVVNKPHKSYGKSQSSKYKGLLEHNISLQSMDYEIEKIINEINKENKNDKL